MTRALELSGARVVVTGASSGIGRAVAARFARKGSDVVLVARSEESLAVAADECRAAGVRVLEVCADVADPDAVDRVAAQTVRAWGGIDVWVNNVGVMAYGELVEVPVATQRRVVEVNLLGTMWGTRAALRVMKEQGRGAVVNVSSLYGKVTTPYVTGYSASKFGILGFSQAVREELFDYPEISVSVVLPGSGSAGAARGLAAARRARRRTPGTTAASADLRRPAPTLGGVGQGPAARRIRPTRNADDEVRRLHRAVRG
jgi:short-subunit dehydrogenase